MRPADRKNPVHLEATQLDAFTQALASALRGDITEVESEALDTHFPVFPSCGSQAARVTGLGCLTVGLGSAVSGGIMSPLIDDASERHDVMALFVGGGVALTLLGLGMRVTQYVCESMQKPPLRSEERRLLEALNLEMQGRVSEV